MSIFLCHIHHSNQLHNDDKSIPVRIVQDTYAHSQVYHTYGNEDNNL